MRRPVEIEQTRWSGDGELTRELVDAIAGLAAVAFVRVEDAPATRTAADYQFLSNEIFVRFVTVRRWTLTRVAGLPWPRRGAVPVMTVAALQVALAARSEIGEPDFADHGMLQYLRAQRVVPPYQTRGIKIVELVRVYPV